MRKIYPSVIISLIICCFFRQSIEAQAQWTALGNGLPDTNSSCNTFCIYNGDLIAGGYFSGAGSAAANNVAKWNSNTWLPMGTGVNGDLAGFIGVLGLTVFQEDLYAYGEFDSAGGQVVNGLAKWNGSQWSAVGQGNSQFFIPLISAAASYNNKLIVGGAFDSIGGVAALEVAQWDGISWSPMGSGISGNPSAFAVYNGTLYAGGSFSTGPGEVEYGLASWNGTEWTNFAPLNYSANNSSFPGVNTLAVYNGNLYAGGIFDSINGIAANGIAAWNGSTWSNLDNGLSATGYTPGALAMTVANNSLYVAGQFLNAGGIPDTNLAVWNGTDWLTVEGLYSTNYISALLTVNDNIYVGGNFKTIAGIPVNNVAVLNTVTGIIDFENNPTVTVFPNPNSGKFNLSLKGKTTENAIGIYNVLGNQVMQRILEQGENELNLNDAAKGIYFYRITTSEGEQVAAGKILVN